MRMFGSILPFVGWRKIPLNRDLSVVDTGKADTYDETGMYYQIAFVIEWFGWAQPIFPAVIRSNDNRIIEDDELPHPRRRS